VTIGSLQPRVGELERRYLNGTFAELCRIESSSGRERRCAERVIAELRALGVSAHEDGAGALVGSECGNLLARIPAGGRPYCEQSPAAGGSCVLLCAHLDTLPSPSPAEPVLRDGCWVNAGDGILGAHSKAAVAVLLALARHICREGAGVDVELLFTVAGESALAGARAFDESRLRSSCGYLLDHTSPIGELVLSAPARYRVEASFHGACADGAPRQERGGGAILAAARAIAAMPLGRLDEETTVNIHTIAGGGPSANDERCSIVADVSALGDGRAESAVGELVERAHEAANLPECECDVDVAVEQTLAGYRLPATRPAVQAAEAALRACGFEPARIASRAGSDANALIARGIDVVNLANGVERGRERDERVGAAALEEMLALALALLDSVAARSPELAR